MRSTLVLSLEELHCWTGHQAHLNTSYAENRSQSSHGNRSFMLLDAQSWRLISGEKGSVLSMKCNRLLYVFSVWVYCGLKTTGSWRIINLPYFLVALGIARFYRTVSDAAVMILAGIPSDELLAREILRVVFRIKTDKVPLVTTTIIWKI